MKPCVVGRDFNVIAYAAESRGGMDPSVAVMRDFGDIMTDYALLDAGFEGSPFTWLKRRLWQRLDHVLL